jgi:hypothetical protein
MRGKRGWGRSSARARRGRGDVCRGKRDRVRAAGRPTRGVSRNSIESIAPDGHLRRVDTFSRLVESSAAATPPQRRSSTRRDCREVLFAATAVPAIATPRHAHSSRAAEDASPRHTGSALPVHRRDGLRRCERARLGRALRSSKRRYRVRVVRGGAIAAYVEDKKTAQKKLTVAVCRLS